jgi:glycosyltransferase involved in cell wall biosynthesis
MSAFLSKSLIVLMPVYEDVEASSLLFRRLVEQLGGELFIVAVDDGSVRHPLTINALKDAGASGVVLRLKRNVGHQRAISIGMAYVADRIQDHQRLVVMDSDGEDLPASIPTLLSGLSSPETDVVVAQRLSRVETFRFIAFYAVYKRIFSFLSGRSISFGNFMALKPPAVRRLAVMQETTIHVAAAVLASKLRISYCPLDRGPRYAGQSKMNFVGLALHGFKGLMVFAEDVLVRVGIACSAIATFSLIGIISATVLKLVGFSTPGWFSVALGILVLMLLQTGALSLMTLMLTGVVRSGSVTSSIAYRDFIEQELT